MMRQRNAHGLVGVLVLFSAFTLVLLVQRLWDYSLEAASSGPEQEGVREQRSQDVNPPTGVLVSNELSISTTYTSSPTVETITIGKSKTNSKAPLIPENDDEEAEPSGLDHDTSQSSSEYLKRSILYNPTNFTATTREQVFDRFHQLIKGKEYLVFQVDNRAYNIIVNGVWNVSKNFSDSGFGSSILSVSRWAKQRNYAYVLNLSPRVFLDPLGNRSVSFYWQKVPPFIAFMEFALKSNPPLLKAILYVDTDVYPHVYLPMVDHSRPSLDPPLLFDYPLGRSCDKRYVPIGKSAKVSTAEEFLARQSQPLAHCFIAPGHGIAQGLLHQKQFYPRIIPSTTPPLEIAAVNGGAMLLRVTERALGFVNDWFLNLTLPDPLELRPIMIGRYSSMFPAELNKARQWIANITERQVDEYLSRNPNSTWRGRAWLVEYLDLIDDSYCTPMLKMYPADKPIQELVFWCRGLDNDVVMRRRIEFCKFFPPKMPCDPFKRQSNTAAWPGDQGRLTWLVLRATLHGDRNLFSVSHSSKVLFSHPGDTGRFLKMHKERLFIHNANVHTRAHVPMEVATVLMQEDEPQRCHLNMSEWEVQALKEYRSLPAFAFNVDLPWVEMHNRLFGSEPNPDNGMLVEFFNM